MTALPVEKKMRLHAERLEGHSQRFIEDPEHAGEWLFGEFGEANKIGREVLAIAERGVGDTDEERLRWTHLFAEYRHFISIAEEAGRQAMDVWVDRDYLTQEQAEAHLLAKNTIGFQLRVPARIDPWKRGLIDALKVACQRPKGSKKRAGSKRPRGRPPATKKHADVREYVAAGHKYEEAAQEFGYSDPSSVSHIMRKGTKSKVEKVKKSKR